MTVARLQALTKKPGRLRAIAAGLVGEVTAVMDRRLDTALKTMQTEPPPKPDSSYVRTHSYTVGGPNGRGWQRSDVRLRADGLIGTLSNDAKYATLVGGTESGIGQLPMHAATGWPLLATALRDQHGLSLAQELRKVLHDAI